MRLNLRTYLFLCLGLIAAVPALLLGGVLTQQAEGLQMAQSDRETMLAAEAIARETAQLMQAHTVAVQGLSRQVEAAGTLEPSVLQGIVSAQHGAAERLGNMWVADTRAVSIAVDPPLDAQGKPAAGTDYSDRDYYKKVSATNATSYSRAQLGRTTRRPNLQIAEPVRDRSGAFIGFSQGAVELSEIQDLAAQVVGHRPDLRAVVLDSEGRVLAHPDSSARSEMRDVSAVQLFQRSNEKTEIRTGVDEQGVGMRAAVAPIRVGDLQWTALVMRTEADVAARAAEIRTHTLVTAAMALLSGLLLALVLAGLLARPIVRLASVATAVGRGDFSAFPPSPQVWLPREVGSLLLAVRDMVVQLRARTEELEQRVEERTLALQAARDEAQDAQQRYRSLFDHNSDAVFSFDLEGRFTSANQATATLLGYGLEELEVLSLASLTVTEDRERALDNVRRAAAGEPHTTEIAVLNRSGDRLDLQLNSMPIVVGERIVGAFALAKDITARKQAEQALEYQALHDSLTGLPNRTLLRDRLEVAIQQARREETSVSLLLMDLDRFKEVNDSLGHSAGDELLCEVSKRLRLALRASDTVARLGGDEFAVVLPRTSLEAGLHVGRALLRVFAQPIEVAGVAVSVGASVGLAVGMEHGGDPDTLLRCADVAMYAAKRSGTDCVAYAPELDHHAPDHLGLATDLQRAIDTDELVLHYQPKIDLATGRVVGIEALVRWQHPERGLVPPDAFIPLAEQAGLIDAVSTWVLNSALRQCHAWREKGIRLPVAVNLSPQNLHDVKLPEKIAGHLAAWDLDPSALAIELTERALIVQSSQTIGVLSQLREMGIEVAIDDFGVGNAALGYLRTLPADLLKIDKSFIKEMLSNNRDDAIVRASIELAHSLGLTVVAEGVEDLPTLEHLGALGCDVAQGYYLSRPLTAARLEEWLSEANPNRVFDQAA
jgi:diguanylate cyclase (GGDEF)-like protein/PAS domain S-box-containing protein